MTETYEADLRLSTFIGDFFILRFILCNLISRSPRGSRMFIHSLRLGILAPTLFRFVEDVVTTPMYSVPSIYLEKPARVVAPTNDVESRP
jgi:hypothetical protein